MAAVVSLLVILTVSLIATRIATVTLVHTGLSKEAAQFQARSAFTGVGFTTAESECIVNHPVRRRIAMVLMLMGNAGIVSAVASLLLTFLDTGPGSMTALNKVIILVMGLVLLWSLAASRLVDRWLSGCISRALEKWTDLNIRDYASLLHLAENHQVQEMAVKEGDWLDGRTLADAALSDEGVIVIGIQRPDGDYVAAPDGKTKVTGGDQLVIYGQDAVLKELDARRRGDEGDEAHRKAVSDYARGREEKSRREKAE
ncbi:MAG: TrkA C-terminal domain-containing protein [Kiritimatiellia bacterium]